MTLGEFRLKTHDLLDSTEVELVMDSEHYVIHAVSIVQHHERTPHYRTDQDARLGRVERWDVVTTPIVRLYI